MSVPKQEVLVGSANGKVQACNLLVQCGVIKSMAEGRRLIALGGVNIDGETVTDSTVDVIVKAGTIVKVGKHLTVQIAGTKAQEDVS